MVRPWVEIRATLDERGMLDSLPFMPEMLKYCGRTFTVRKRLERTCEETEGGMRRIRNVVFLDNLRCDGSAHGGCQKGCLLFWKDAWLASGVRPDVHGDVAIIQDCPYRQEHADDEYVCQSTELIRATSRLSPLDLGVYVRDIRAKTYSVTQLVRILVYAAFLRVRHWLTGQSYRFLTGTCNKTPAESLGLVPGECVRVKTRDEIAMTLDSNGKNRGLAFTVEMIPFCGGKFRVLRRLDKMIEERTRRMLNVHDTVILENVTCDGCHILRGGCPRDNYHFWREVWLKRAPAERRG